MPPMISPFPGAYFGDYRRIFTLLPHIRLVKAYDAHRFRVLYHSVELGVYEVKIYCDLHAGFVDGRPVLRVSPINDITPVAARVTMTSLTAQGSYQSDSIFKAHSGPSTTTDAGPEAANGIPAG